MDIMEKAIISHLEMSAKTHDAASLMAISQILNSINLYETAKKRLVQNVGHLELRDAERIGAKAVYEVMNGAYNGTLNNSRNLPKPDDVCHTCRNGVYVMRCNWCDTTL
jgi:hypothetical protein